MKYTRYLRSTMPLLLIGLLFLSAGCALLQEKPSPALSLQKAGIHSLRIGVTPNYPPIMFKKDSVLSGIEADLADRLSGDLSLSITFVELPFAEQLTALRNNKIDVIMAGMSITDKRAKQAGFTHPILETGQVAIVRATDISRFSPPKETLYVNGLRVGYEAGTTGMTFAVDSLLLAELSKFPSADDGLAALRDRKIDAFIHDAFTARRMAAEGQYKNLIAITEPLTREEIAWAVRHEDKILRESLNRTIDRWKKQGVLKQITEKWINSAITD